MWVRWDGVHSGTEGVELEEDEALGVRRTRKNWGAWKYSRIGSPKTYSSQEKLIAAVRELGCGETPDAPVQAEWDGMLRWLEEGAG